MSTLQHKDLYCNLYTFLVCFYFFMNYPRVRPKQYS